MVTLNNPYQIVIQPPKATPKVCWSRFGENQLYHRDIDDTTSVSKLKVDRLWYSLQ